MYSKVGQEVKEPYFECPRCKIDSLIIDRRCPCPRGSCEAVLKGYIITTAKFVPLEENKFGSIENKD